MKKLILFLGLTLFSLVSGATEAFRKAEAGELISIFTNPYSLALWIKHYCEIETVVIIPVTPAEVGAVCEKRSVTYGDLINKWKEDQFPEERNDDEGKEKKVIYELPTSTLARLERQREGIAVAKLAGKYKGRPKKIDNREILRILAEGNSISKTANLLGVSMSSVQRAKREAW